MAWQPDYITPGQLKAYVRVDDVLDDEEVADAVTAACRAVDRAAHRQFGRVETPEARVYTAVWDRHQHAHLAVIDDLQDLTGLSVMDSTGTAITSAQYTLLPVNNPAKGKPYETIRLPRCGEYTMTGRWGWTAIPTVVKLASKLQGSRFLARRDSPYGIAGSPAQGSEMRLLAQCDPDVRVALAPVTRRWWAA